MCFYCLTFLWVYQHLSSRRLFIKYHLLPSFASLPLFSPLNCSLREGFTFMFFHVQPLGRPFPALWGWHLDLHNNLYSSSLPPSLVRSALARDGSRSWLALAPSVPGEAFGFFSQKVCCLPCCQTLPHKPNTCPFCSFPSVWCICFGCQWFILTFKSDCVNFRCVSRQMKL